ncbi:type II secretion system F family protein [Saccharopolyspora taberi]|uniref:Type II secretion system protein n=1 Tax=Saccharopolyspora taberi TaxID=60895 RepID=A0ABN3VCK2_9PSEU
MLTFLLLAAALLCWPVIGARHRLKALRPHRGRSVALLGRVRVWYPVAAAAGAVVAGVGGVIGALALGVLVRGYRRSRRDQRNRAERTAELAAGVRLLVAELRVGAHPAVAAEGAARDAAPGVAGVFRDMAVTARLGGDIASALRAHDSAALREPLGRMARAWALAERHGVALADLLEAVRRDLEHRGAFVRDLEAKMAGPRATAAMLAGLPALGLLLGQAVGAAPLAFLTGHLAGQVLLATGVALLCAGMLWTLRLTEGAVPP